MTCKNFCLYYIVPVIYYSWYSLTNKGGSKAVLAIPDSCYRSSEKPGHYYLIRMQNTTLDLNSILSIRLSTWAFHKVALLLISLELYIPFLCLIVLIVEAPDLLIREKNYLDLYIAFLYEIPDIFLLIPET
jgi:hypothetical protein